MGNIDKIRSSFIAYIESLNVFKKKALWSLADGLCFIFASFFGWFIFYKMISLSLKFYLVFTIVSFVIYMCVSVLLRMGSRIKRYIGLRDMGMLFFSVVFASLLGNLISSILAREYSTRYSLVTAIFAALAVVGLRIIWQTLYQAYNDSNKKKAGKVQNAILFGAGEGGYLFLKSYQRNRGQLNIVGILDKDTAKWGTIIQGVRVHGDISMLEELIERFDVKKAIIAIPSLEPEAYEQIIAECNRLDLKVYNMPKVEDVLLGIHKEKDLQKVNIADLLGRQEVDLDESALRQELEGKVILITGAGGSIGSEISRQVSRYHPEQIILLGHGENSIYQIYHEQLAGQNQYTQFVPVIADVQDYPRLHEIISKYQPDIIYHAAAHKHVPMMEANPGEAFKNNVLGTYNVAKAVDELQVPKMVMISTDKAVRPPNVMGATKRMAELIVTSFNRKSDSIYCAVRFGNVLGSRGSVVPAFERMIQAGGPVKVTDFRMTRYFMTIPEASRLVIHAGAMAIDGEVFILDMGQPVKIYDLAKKMILLSGKELDEIEIVESGIRPGEKLYEELLISEDNVAKQLDDKVYVSHFTEIDLTEIDQVIAKLQQLLDQPNQLKQAIIEFANQSAKYE